MRLRILACCALLPTFFAPVAHAVPAYTWGHGYGDEDVQTLSAVATDPAGNVLLCGSFYGSITIKTTLTAGLLGSDFLVAKLDPDGAPVWNRRLAYGQDDVARDVAADKDGNVVAVGTGGGKILMVKYDAAGNQQWLKAIGANNTNGGEALCVATNLANEVIVAGNFWGTVDFGGGPLVEPPIFGDGYEMFVVKFDASGNHIWSKHFAWTFNKTNLAGLETDALGEIVLFGDFVDPVDFGAGPLTSDGFNDLFLAKFRRDGGALWSHRYGSSAADPAACLALSADGRAAIAENLYSAVDFGGGALAPTGSPQPAVAMFTPGGDHVWSRTFVSTTYGFASGMTFAENDLLLSCTGQGTINFGGGPVAATGINYNVFAARLSGSNGTHRWSFAFAGDDNVSGYVAESRGSIIVGGTMDGAANPGGGPLPYAGASDMFVARYGETLTGVGVSPMMATLYQNVPNPFNPTTSIPYMIEHSARVVIGIYDAAGARIARLDEGVQSSGVHATTWNGRDANGHALASGVYFYRFEGFAGSPVRKMVLLK
jgi:hypothetical protein